MSGKLKKKPNRKELVAVIQRLQDLIGSAKSAAWDEFKELEDLFVNFFGAASRDLTDKEKAEIREYVNVGEYGLALETAVDIYVEERKTPTDEVNLLIQRLAECMSIDGKVISTRLQAKNK